MSHFEFEVILPDAASMAQRCGMRALGTFLSDAATKGLAFISSPEIFLDRDEALLRVRAVAICGTPFERGFSIRPLTPEVLDACDVWANLWNLYAGGQ